MKLRNTPDSYGTVTKFFHWLIAFLIIFMLIYGFFLSEFPKNYQPIAYNIHKLTGITILILVILRLLWAAVNPKPLLPPDTSAWQRWAEHAVHFGLYIAILAMPVFGWIGSMAAGRPPHLGAFNLNLPIAKNEALSDAALAIHGQLAIIIITLVSIHVLAALYHHFIKRDNILRRMLPIKL